MVIRKSNKITAHVYLKVKVPRLVQLFICQSCMKLPINAVLQSLHLHFLGGCRVVQSTFSSKIFWFQNDKWLESLTNTKLSRQIHCCTLKWTHISYCGTTDTPLKFSSSESELLFSLIITRLFPPSWSPACAAPSSQTVGRDCSVVEPSGRFVGERQHSSSRIASVAVAELVAATQHSSHSSSVCRCCRRRLTTRIAGAAAVARSCVAQHSRGQQLLFQQLLILLCHGDSHVVTKIFPISTGLGL